MTSSRPTCGSTRSLPRLVAGLAGIGCAALLLLGCQPRDHHPEEGRYLVVHPDDLSLGDPVGPFHVNALHTRENQREVLYGEARFDGLVDLRGRYFDFQPENADPDRPRPCFEVDQEDVHLLPRFPGDTRRTWFCFDNPDAVMEAAGLPTPAGRLTSITISRYHYVHEPTDVVSRATFAGDVQRERGHVAPRPNAVEGG